MYDESWVAVPAYNLAKTGGFYVTAITDFNGYPTTVYQFTCYQAILVVIHFILPKSIIISRLLNVVIVPIIFFLVYFISLRIFKSKTWSVVPVLLLAVDNIFFLTSYIVRPDIVLAIGIPLSIFVMYDNKFNLKKERSVWIGLISIIFVGIHPNYILVIGSFLICYLLFEWSNFSFKENEAIIIKFLIPLLVGLTAVLIFISSSESYKHLNLIDFLKAYLYKTTTIDDKGTILNLPELLRQEGRRYDEFLNYPYRLHILVLFIASLIFGFFSKEKIIKMIALSVGFVLLGLTILIANKNVRYFTMLLPSISILVTWFFYQLNLSLKNISFRRILYSVLLIVVFSSLAGNLFLIYKRWDTKYSDLKNGLYLHLNPKDKVLGDLLLWDIFKDCNYISFMSDLNNLKIQSYDYVILGGKQTIQDETRNYFENKIFPTLRTRFVKEYKNNYYGDYKIYKVLH
ncbi:MAG: hypothetical protein NTX22_14395 [Ignavibacteriales bacterium]|nr:hypothetical protein [Ignavibacteriales bacterium]